MDWERLNGDAEAILQAFLRIPTPVGVDQLLTEANGQDPSWRETTDRQFHLFQALDLLERQALVHRPNGSELELTDAGRAVASTDPELVPIFDHNDPTLRQWAEIEDLSSVLDHRRQQAANFFTRLRVSNWRQFGSVEIAFHPRLTVVTGANASGKTTLLNVLAPHFSWNAQLLSTRPAVGGPTPNGSGQVALGHLAYSNGMRTQLIQSVGAPGVSLSGVGMPGQQGVPGIFISSHRSISTYQQLHNLPARFSASGVLLQQFAAEIQTRYSGGSSQFPPLYRMKEALISSAMHGYGNRAVAPNHEAQEVWEGFQKVLVNFLPKSVSFQSLEVQDGDLFLRTSSSRFPLEAASGGLSAMLELSWQIFLRGRESPAFTVCIDEPENHLHPELQRAIVPALLEGFPEASFVLATHSPFVVTATRDCNIYALKPDASGKIHSRLVGDLNASATPDETLMAVLGLDTPLPIWAEEGLREALRGVPPSPSAEQLRRLKDELTRLGLDRQFPAALDALAGSGET